MLPVSADAIKFFDKRATLETIDRISGVSSVQRGVEYKTNTTNRAIESYESQMQSRADDKMDMMEEAIGRVLWMIAQMCLQFMDEQEVTAILGTVTGWQRIEPKDIPIIFAPRVLGGSALKPTSRAKKDQALQMSQILGQFARGTPAAIIVALKVLQQAFDDELSIEADDWQMIIEGVKGAMQAQAAPSGNAPAQGGGGGEPTEEVVAGVAQVARFLDGLPAELKQQIGVLLARQTPIEEIFRLVVEQMSTPQ
jgi:hypothetical protein